MTPPVDANGQSIQPTPGEPIRIQIEAAPPKTGEAAKP